MAETDPLPVGSRLILQFCQPLGDWHLGRRGLDGRAAGAGRWPLDLEQFRPRGILPPEVPVSDCEDVVVEELDLALDAHDAAIKLGVVGTGQGNNVDLNSCVSNSNRLKILNLPFFGGYVISKYNFHLN